MDRDTVIALAKKADLWMTSDERIAAVERFAALVAAHEREECAKILDGAPRLVPSLQFPGGHCFVCGLNSEKIAEAIRSRK